MPTAIRHGSRTCASLREILSRFKSSAFHRPRIFRGIRGQRRAPPFVIKAAESSTSSLLRHSSYAHLFPPGSAYRWANVGSRVTFCARPVITPIVFHRYNVGAAFVTCAPYVPAAEIFLCGYTDPRETRPRGLNELLIIGVNIFFLPLPPILMHDRVKGHLVLPIAIVGGRIRVVEPFLSGRTSSHFDTLVASGANVSHVSFNGASATSNVLAAKQNNVGSRSHPWRRQHFIRLNNAIQTPGIPERLITQRNNRRSFHGAGCMNGRNYRSDTWNINQLRQSAVDWVTQRGSYMWNVSNNNVASWRFYKQNL